MRLDVETEMGEEEEKKEEVVREKGQEERRVYEREVKMTRSYSRKRAKG
jgi:hypothetical protein